MRGLKYNETEIVPWDPIWSKMAQRAQRSIRPILPEGVETYHFGATSIDGCDAKPICDIGITWETEDDMWACVHAMETKHNPIGVIDGYGPRTYMYAKESKFDERRTHHFHVMERGGYRDNAVRLFRDLLNEYNQLVPMYVNIKEQAIKEGEWHRSRYTAAKTPFVNAATLLAFHRYNVDHTKFPRAFAELECNADKKIYNDIEKLL
ncbi:MAG: GrpB family protein [Firmicutes bacterium]|nr:GrpB family protein [Bacillota bacterium]